MSIESAVRVQSSKNDLCQVVYDETIEDGFHGFLTNSIICFSHRCGQHWDSEQENCDTFHAQTKEKNLQSRTKSNSKVQEQSRESCYFSPVSKSTVLKKARWHPVAERLNVTKLAFLQSNENPKYQSVRWMAWTTAAVKVPRLKMKLIKSSAFRRIPQKSCLKTSGHPGFRSWSVEQTATLSGKNSPRVW